MLKKEVILPEFVDTRLAAHSEIRALDEAIKVRRSLGLPVTEDIINELYVYNIDLRNMYATGKAGIPSMIPKCRCPNCLKLTEGINTIRHE